MHDARRRLEFTIKNLFMPFIDKGKTDLSIPQACVYLEHDEPRKWVIPYELDISFHSVPVVCLYHSFVGV